MNVLPYHVKSRSARALAKALHGVILTPKDIWREKAINWGFRGDVNGPLLNTASSVDNASHKIRAFEAFKAAGVTIPEFTTDLSEARLLFGKEVVCRHIIRGSGGRGIEMASMPVLPQARLYVEYIPKDDEFRVHFLGEDAFLVQRKARNYSIQNSDVDWKIRNHRNGFIFQRNDVKPPKAVVDEARLAVQALGLDFGAADVVWNAKRQKAYVLEVNTAPGLEGSTLTDYVTAFSAL